MKVLVCGAGGFIGGHLMNKLVAEGHSVTAVDIKPLGEWEQPMTAPPMMDEGQGLRVIGSADLRLRPQVHDRFHNDHFDVIYNLAADMGGIGYITTHRIECVRSALINFNMLEYAQASGVDRYFFASSACIYPADRQDTTLPLPLTEDSAYPAMCEDGYGWEKLFAEQVCQHYHDELGLEARVARLHNVYGPMTVFDGGREKAPAAICRKVATAVLTGDHNIDVWGDGHQTRSFTFIDDTIKGIELVAMGGAPLQPVNVGSEEMVTINRLIDYVEQIAGIRVKRNYQLDAPQGVRGRSSENTLLRKLYGWEPTTSLLAGLEPTYRWIHDKLVQAG